MNQRDAGFSLYEVMIALVIVMISALGAHAMITTRFTGTANRVDHQTTAMQIVEDRLAQVQAHPAYGTLTATFGEATATPVPGYAGFSRQTIVSRTTTLIPATGRTRDLTMVTVTVQPTVAGANAFAPVARTIAVAAP